MTKLYRLENIESYLDYLTYNSIKEFTSKFCNETLSKVYRLLIFSKEIDADPLFLFRLKCTIERESLERNFDCFKVIKQEDYNVIDVIYHEKELICI